MALHSSNTVKNYNILTKLIFGILHLIERALLLFFELLIRLFSLLGFSSLEKKKQKLIKEDFKNWANFVQNKREDSDEDPNLKQGQQPDVISGLLRDALAPKPLTDAQRAKIDQAEANESKQNAGKGGNDEGRKDDPKQQK